MSEIYCINYIGYTVNDELTSNSESYSEFELSRFKVHPFLYKVHAWM